MNREIVDNILGVIRTSTDKAVIVKALFKLRTDLVHTQEGIEIFRVVGGVPPMVRLLHKPHEKILEVVLSILGNCCTDKACCKQAFTAKCIPPLATILKSIPNPVIQCRACRLLGNLAKNDSAQLLVNHCQSIALAVCQIIVDTSDVQTRLMAYRACHFLLANPQFLKHFLQANGFATLLRILAAIMKKDAPSEAEQALPIEQPESALGLKKTQHREQYFEEVARHFEGVRSDIFDHEVLKNAYSATNMYAMPKEKAARDLACEILKCLLVMSEMHIALPVWEAITRSGCTLVPVVFFMSSSEENKHRSVSLKILSNFSKNPGAFYILSSSDAIVSACELLVSSSASVAGPKQSLSESERRHCINVISMLSPDACNRSKIRRSGALRKLVVMLRDSDSQVEIASILQLLNYFQYDNMSMDLMFREGLILVLVKELNAFLTEDDDYHKKRREERLRNAKKRKLPEHINETSVCKFAKKRDETYLDCESPSSSPRSLFAPNSPCSSRGMSPAGGSPFQVDCESDDETYSPVCSDDDDDDDEDDNDEAAADGERMQSRDLTVRNSDGSAEAEPPAGNENSEIMKLLDLAASSEILADDEVVEEDDVNLDDEISKDSSPTKQTDNSGKLPLSTIDVIENLLFRATLLMNKRPELGKSETLSVLVRALNVFGAQNNFAASLTNVLLESQFFAQVIKQGIAHQLYLLSKVDEMRKDSFAFLETLTCVGESNYGKAELARLLRCDDSTSQIRAATTVAHIIKGHRLLYQFLNDGNALSVLFDIILRRNRDELTAEAVDALTAMCLHTLGMKLPQIDDEDATRAPDRYEEYTLTKEPDACDMSFLVHSEPKPLDTEKSTTTTTTPTAPANTSATAVERVPFRKQLLCDTSEVFNTMLNSDFREGNEGEIHLHGYTVDGLRYFLDLVVRLAHQKKLSIPTQHKYRVLLEAFEMSRVYIIPAMEEFVQQLLVCLLDADNCLQVFEWSMKNYHAELMEMAVNFYLCSQLATDVKVKLFRAADDSNFGTEWFQMLFDAVFVRCRNGI